MNRPLTPDKTDKPYGYTLLNNTRSNFITKTGGGPYLDDAKILTTYEAAVEYRNELIEQRDIDDTHQLKIGAVVLID